MDIFIQPTDQFLSDADLYEKHIEMKKGMAQFKNVMERINSINEKLKNPNIEFSTRRVCNYYRVFSISDLIIIGLYEIFKNKKIIKRCKECNLFFRPKNRTDEKYCNNQVLQKILNKKFTCKEKGKIHCEMRRASSDVNKIYNSIRVKLYNKYTSSDPRVTDFIDEHHKKYIAYKNGEIKKKELIDWMDTYYVRGRKIKQEHFDAIKFWNNKQNASQ